MGSVRLMEGAPAPSVSHKQGKNDDLRYLRTDESGNAVVLGDKKVDVKRQLALNNSLFKFGWKDMISEKFKPAGSSKSTLLPHTSSAAQRGIPTNHTNHLHLQGYNPTRRVQYVVY